MDYNKLIILELGKDDQNNARIKHEEYNKEHIDMASMLFA